VHDVICSAIRDQTLLEFDYGGLHRVVAPYCHGSTSTGEALRAIQVRGQSRSRAIPSGKLWLVEKMQNLRPTAESFVPDDPHYNPADRAMLTIHCAVERRAGAMPFAQADSAVLTRSR
jgi:hypothetical protein